MRTLTVPIPVPIRDASYEIFFGYKIVSRLSSLFNFRGYSKVAVVYDAGLYAAWGEASLKDVAHIVIPATGERQKDHETLAWLWSQFQKAGLDRHSLVLAAGGGATGDLVGFAAATYMRGIPFIGIPTTLLSQVDSSIGGKNGINVGEVKNLVGTFFHPQAVVIDVDFLTTLPKRELASGFAEIIKHGAIHSRGLFNDLSSTPVCDLAPDALLKFIERSCEIKLSVVRQDPFEKGLRKILNFGHTIGHAFEALALKTEAPLTHGEAIAIGMVGEAMLAERTGLASETLTESLRKTLSSQSLPIKAPKFPLSDLMTAMRADKKNKEGKIMFSLVSTIGTCLFDQGAEDKAIEETLTALMV